MTGITGPKRLADLAEGRTDNNFDFLRIVLASLVMLSHSWSLLQGHLRADPLSVASHGQMDSGAMAVNAFFILSGFLITQSWLRSASSLDYLTRRVLRIYPGFLVAAAITAVVFSPMLEPDPRAYWRDFPWPKFLTGLLDLRLMTSETSLVNGSLWSIRFEFLCYLGVIVLGSAGLLGRRARMLAALLMAMGTLAAQEVLGMKIPGSRFAWIVGLVECWPRVASNFLAGMIFFLYRDRIVLSAWGFRAAVAGLILLCVQPWVRLLPVGFPMLGGYLLFYLAYVPARWMHGWARRCDLSYGMYLYAYPIQRLLVRLLGPSLEPRWASITPMGIFVATIPLAVACAFASWWLVESPTMKLRRPLATWLDRPLGAGAARASVLRVHLGRRPPSPSETPVPVSRS
jgi:peptidoglycan/LPS O-acetylase OafA/YrhL